MLIMRADDADSTYFGAVIADELRDPRFGSVPVSSGVSQGQETIPLFDFMVSIAQARADLLTAKGLTLDLRGDQRAGTIRGDRLRLGAAIGGLIDNAIVSTDAGGRILIELSRLKNGNARLVISDNGEGLDLARLASTGAYGAAQSDGVVPEQQSQRLLEARHLIEALGGAFELMSELGAGTTVIIELP
jgi:hypothetical protein